MKHLLVAGFVAPLLALVGAAFAVDQSPGRNSLPGRGELGVFPTHQQAIRARILGSMRVGELLVGAVKGPKPKTPRKLAFQWMACDWTGTTCEPLAFARRQRYRVRKADLGATLRVQVTISKPAPRRTLLSPASTVVTGPTDPIVAAAGDIACDPTSSGFRGGLGSRGSCRQKWTSDLLLNSGLSAVLPLGDIQYECGVESAFLESYAPSWGRLKRITRPALGNHEYGRGCGTNDASAYFRYFGAAAGAQPGGWYSYDIGSWHLIALNSECSYGSGASAVGGCGPGSPQETWLRRDLASHSNFCTLAYWHEPRFSSGQHGDAQQMATIWNHLVAAKADIVLAGHNHDYERFEPAGFTPQEAAAVGSTTTGTPNHQSPNLDPTGIRSWVVGTGGKNHYGFGSVPPLRGQVVRDATTYGVLKLTLHPTSYDWQFVNDPGSGSFTDSGTGNCH